MHAHRPENAATAHPRPVLLFSPVLAEQGVPHAFTTRVGGVSRGQFETLNFGNPGELRGDERDPPANIARNIDLVLGEIGAAGRRVVQVHQVHGADVHVLTGSRPSGAGPDAEATKADAIVTDDPGSMAMVRVADCAPVLLSSVGGEVVAAVHAGWRGVVAGVLPAAIDAMRGVAPAACARGLVGAAGPCISMDRFEIGPEVAEQFFRLFGARTRLVRPGAPGRFHADLRGALLEQFNAKTRSGGGDGGTRHGTRAFDILPGCTCGDGAWYFSHRRDGVRSGRLAAFVGPAPR